MRGASSLVANFGGVHPGMVYVVLFAAILAVTVGLIWHQMRELDRRREQIALQETALDAAPIAIFITDREGRIQWVNPAFERISGYEAAELVGATPDLIASPGDDGDSYRALWRMVLAGDVWRGEFVQRTKSGGSVTIDQTMTPIRKRDRSIGNVLVVQQDITARKQAEDNLHRAANFDFLTALPNRGLFMDRLAGAVAASNRSGLRLAVLLLDLDRFKDVNDTLGHSVGDGLLVEVARRISGCMRKGDTLARLGGDEFVVLAGQIADEVEIGALAERIVGLFSRPFAVADHSLSITSSIGIAVHAGDGDGAENLLRHADLALYQAKANGRDTYQFFSAALNDRVVRRRRIEADLERAIREDEFFLLYQPELDCATAEIRACEALLRWRRADGTMVPPVEFIPVAEDTGAIIPLGWWVISAVTREIVRWHNQGITDLSVGVNLSAVQLRQADFFSRVVELIEASGAPFSAFDFELTESVFAEVDDRTLLQIANLRRRGARFTIDDFGSGFSSMRYIKDFPVDRIKIDKYFVDHIAGDERTHKVVDAMVQLAYSIGAEVVAEGVETHAQVQALVHAGCQVIQGYIVGRPMGVEALSDLWDPLESTCRHASLSIL